MSFLTPVPRPDAEGAFVVFHHAGGSPANYRGWARWLPEEWELLIAEYPPPSVFELATNRTIVSLAECLLPSVERILSRRRVRAFFGHSMGSLVAFEISKRLARRGAPKPDWLGLSAHAAPLRAGPSESISTEAESMSDQELIRRCEDLGLISWASHAESDRRAAFGRILRSDFAACESYRASPAARVATTVSLYSGADDAIASPESMVGWRKLIGGTIRSRTFEGGHFYFAQAHRAFRMALIDDLNRSWTECTRSHQERYPTAMVG